VPVKAAILQKKLISLTLAVELRQAILQKKLISLTLAVEPVGV